MPSILNNSSSTLTNASIANSFNTSLLNTARQINRSGIGLSANARSGINSFISATQGGFNELFSLATGPSLSVEGLQTQIKGLRASVPGGKISEKLAAELAAEDQKALDKAIAANNADLKRRGFIVDTEA